MDPKTIEFAKKILDETNSSKTSLKKNAPELIKYLKEFVEYASSIVKNVLNDPKKKSEDSMSRNTYLKSLIDKIQGEILTRLNDFIKLANEYEEMMAKNAKIILNASDKYDEPTKKWINDMKIQLRQENDPFYTKVVDFNDFFMKNEKMARQIIGNFKKVDLKKTGIAKVASDYFILVLQRVEHGFNMVDPISL